VSPIPGTTRDVVEVSLDIGGYPIMIGDTAGLRSSKDEIEMEGVRRAQDRIGTADINIAILPVNDFRDGGRVDPIVLDAIRRNPKTMVLVNKMDLLGKDADEIKRQIGSLLWPEQDHTVFDQADRKSEEANRSTNTRHRLWAISCQTGEGIGVFLQDFIAILKDR